MSAAITPLLVELRAATAALVVAHEAGQPEQVAGAYAEAQRSLDALGPLLLIQAAAPKVVSFVPPAAKRGATCPKCGEKLTIVPSAGFGAAVRNICGACGHDIETA